MSGRPAAAYPEIVKRMPGTAPAASQRPRGGAPGVARADPGAGGPRRGPRVVAPAVAAPGVHSAGGDDAGAGRGEPGQHARQPTVTPAPPSTCRASPCYSLHYPPLSIGQLLLAVAVVTPLLLAARYPLLGWRIGWLALLLAPLVPQSVAGRLAVGPGAAAGTAGGVLRGRGSLWAAGAVVDVGAEPHPLVAVAC